MPQIQFVADLQTHVVRIEARRLARARLSRFLFGDIDSAARDVTGVSWPSLHPGNTSRRFVFGEGEF